MFYFRYHIFQFKVFNLVCLLSLHISLRSYCFSVDFNIWWSMFIMQLSVEQHGLELHGPTYMQIFVSSKYYSIAWSMVDWICRCGISDMEDLRIWRADCKLYLDFWLCGRRISAPNPAVLFKGQLCMSIYALKFLVSPASVSSHIWHFFIIFSFGNCSHFTGFWCV